MSIRIMRLGKSWRLRFRPEAVTFFVSSVILSEVVVREAQDNAVEGPAVFSPCMCLSIAQILFLFGRGAALREPEIGPVLA
jgi:hypothetical protein